MDSMYEVLMELPLFKGVSFNKISEIVEMVKFHFLKFSSGDVIVRADEPCTHLKFVISGSVKLVMESKDERLRVTQTLKAPAVISPDFMFGRSTVYPATVTASSNNCGIVQLSKSDYLKVIHNDEIFMFNILNLLSRNAQKSTQGVLALTSGSLEERIAFWVVATTQTGSENIVLECRHRDLYSLFGVPRSVFYQTLQEMREKSLIDYSPNQITVKSRRDMTEILLRHL